MKLSRNQVRRKAQAVPHLRFEDQRLTYFSGLFLFQLLFARLGLKARLRRRFDSGQEVYWRSLFFLSLVVHILLGYRRLRDSRYYRDDTMVQRLLGLERLPTSPLSLAPSPNPARRAWSGCDGSAATWSSNDWPPRGWPA